MPGSRVACCHSSQCIFSDMCDVTMIGSCVLLSAAISRAPYGECRLGEKTGAGCDGGTGMVQCVTGGLGGWPLDTEQRGWGHDKVLFKII